MTNFDQPSEDTQQLSIELITTPRDERPIYIVGNFNGWQENDKWFKMKKIEDGKYRYTFLNSNILPNPLEYKYVRGEWADDELDKYGNPTPKRELRILEGAIQDNIERWQNKGLEYNPQFLPKINVIDEEFEIPQLIKTRRIAALLPCDYEETDKRYPVLYLQDGQNLFDDHAPFGNWGVDKKLAILKENGMGDIIVISIDHAEKDRIAEFTPSYETKLGVGMGKKYARFLADTLKPFVDKNYRTFKGSAHTGIGGSSMGGLISVYATLMYPEVYGKLLVFSPAFWVTPDFPYDSFALHQPKNIKVYLYAGGRESISMIPNVQKFKKDFEQKAKNVKVDFKLEIDTNGLHNEMRWGMEFPKAVEWLFFNE